MKWLLLSVFSIMMQLNDTTDFSTIQREASAKQLPILLIFSGSDWCASCIGFRRNVLDKDEFQQHIGKLFLLYKADFPRNDKRLTESRKQQNNTLAEQYNRAGYFPKVVLISADGIILKQKNSAFSTPKKLIDWLQ